ncbi:hypothetical protein [Actinoplanes sp. NPDC023714]|uniref:hypothetical protein n=1 Tax=Actinoplanes sp. NPDC023714 TaxID=3154322 RepID=UPI0033DB8DC7
MTDSGGLDAYDYDFDGGRWIARDATAEPPFAAAAGLPLTAWTATSDGVRLEFGGHLILFRTHGGEVRT